MLNVGMVGVGNISGIYLKNLSEVFQGLRLIAVCDLIRERAEKAQKEFGVPKLYDTMEELFADEEIDIVLNLTRPYQHYAVSKAALLAGKHVYSEKPLAATLEQGKELLQIATEKNLLIGGAPDTFLGAGIQTCRKLLEEGIAGEVFGGRCVMASHGMESWHTDPDFFYQPVGGPLFDMGPYYITAMINLLGGVKSVYGYHQTAYQTRLITAEPHVGEIIQVNTPTHIEAFLTFDCGAKISMLTSFDIYGTRQTNIEVYGTKGTLYVPNPNFFYGPILFANGETGKEEEQAPCFDYAENSRSLGLADLAVAIETGRPGRATIRQTLHVLDVMDSIMKSAELGAPVEIETRFEKEAPMDPTLPHGVL